MQPNVDLHIMRLPTVAGISCQTLVITLRHLAKPADLTAIQLPPNLDFSQGVLIFGVAPIWLYAHLIDRCRAAPWIATYHVRKQSGVVVASHTPAKAVGDQIPIQPGLQENPAILIGGPPNSGKSVLAHALHRALMVRSPHLNTHLFRANWDGEGNHTYESRNRSHSDQLRRANSPQLHHQTDAATKITRFFQKQGHAIPNLRRTIDLTFVDIGGRADRDRLPVIQACTHLILISKDPDQILVWRNLCDRYLHSLAVIHSVLEPRLNILRTDPVLELIAGPWQRGQTCSVPDILCDRILSIMPHKRQSSAILSGLTQQSRPPSTLHEQ